MATSPMRRISRATQCVAPACGSPRAPGWRPVGGPRPILTVDQLHQSQILGADRALATVDCRPADTQQGTLAVDGHGGMRTVDHRATLGPVDLPSLLAKQSRSTFNWPIWR